MQRDMIRLNFKEEFDAAYILFNTMSLITQNEDQEAMRLKEQLFASIDLRTRRIVEWQDKLRSHWSE